MTRKISAAARLLICVLLAISIAIPTGTFFAKAETGGSASDSAAAAADSPFDSVTVSGDLVTINTKVKYSQTDARDSLEFINDLRADQHSDLQPLNYDYDLEKIAMQRAAELALVLSLSNHARPDGTDPWTILDDYGYASDYTNYDENIVATDSILTSEEFVKALSGNQSHCQSMLRSDTNAVGIACATINGCTFYVQEFGKTSKITTEFSPSDALENVSVKVLADALIYKSSALTAYDSTMPIGGSQDTPNAAVYFATSPSDTFFGNGLPAVTELKWTSSNPDVVDIVDGKIVAKSIGTAVLTAPYTPVVSAGNAPTSFTATITVEPTDISNAVVTLEYNEVEYTGSVREPKITAVTVDGKTIVLTNENCTIVYENNKNPGTAKVTITGKGDYKGSVTKTFTIKNCSHTYDDGTVVSSADCTHDGQKKFECTKCDHEKTEAIPALGHVSGSDATCTKDQTCTVCNAVIKEKTGHTPTSGAFDCTKDQKCSVCNEVYHKAGSHTAGAAATCTTDQTCTVCGAVLKEKTGHTPNAADATCTVDQKCTVCNTVLKEAPGHTPGAAATCTTDQKCTVCNTILTLATGHKPGASATCTTDQTCTVCNAVVKKATGHTPGNAATCGTDQKCKVCGAVVTKATGNHTDANKDTKCDVCGTSVSGKGPTTGEIVRSNLPVIIASAAVLASIVAIVVVLIKQRKNKFNG